MSKYTLKRQLKDTMPNGKLVNDHLRLIPRGVELAQHFTDSEIKRPDAVMLFDGQFEESGMLSFADGIDGLYAKTNFDLFDPYLNMPKTEFFYQTLMPLRFGGGFIETYSAFKYNLSLVKFRLAGGNTNEIPTAKGAPERIFVPSYAMIAGLIIGEIDYIKSDIINYDIYGVELEALRISWQRELELLAMIGNEGMPNIEVNGVGFHGGLLNQNPDNILLSQVLTEDWRTWDVNQWVSFFIQYLTLQREAVGYVPERYVNTVVVPTEIYATVLQTAVVGTTPLAESIWEYVIRQVEVFTNSRFYVVDIPYVGAKATPTSTTAGIVANGINGTGRIAFFRYDEEMIRMQIGQPLTTGAYGYSITEGAYRQNVMGVACPPLVIWGETIMYVDNGVAQIPTFEVTYELDGGTNATGNPATFDASNLPITLLPATKTGFTFDGWFTDEALTNPITTIALAQNITVYAKFTAE